MCYIRKGAHVKVACYANYNGYDLDSEFFFYVVSHYCLFEWYVYVVYVSYGV